MIYTLEFCIALISKKFKDEPLKTFFKISFIKSLLTDVIQERQRYGVTKLQVNRLYKVDKLQGGVQELEVHSK